MFNPIILYMILLSYIFIQIMWGFTKESALSSSRISYLLVVVILGFLIRKTPNYQNKIQNASFWFICYTLIIVVFDSFYANTILSEIFSTCFWGITFMHTSRMKITDDIMKSIAYVMSITANIIALIYIVQQPQFSFIDDFARRIGAINSIYYVFLLLPFVFLLKKWWISSLFAIIPFYSFLISQKTTCVICVCVIIAYTIYKNIKSLPVIQRFRFIVLMIAIGCIAYNMIDFHQIFFEINEDIGLGGNGRVDIAAKVLDLMATEVNPFYIVFGHGVNSISKTIGIGGHNDFLEVVYCYGVVGLATYLFLWYSLIRYWLKENLNMITKKAFAISLILFIFTSLSSKLVGTQIGMVPLALFWGVVIANKNVTRT